MSSWDTLPVSIPGLGDDIVIQFPKQRLPVCVRCKHHFKTRKLCREKKKHTGLPWRKIYICITLNDSCLQEDNTLKKGSFTSKTRGWRPYQYKATTEINCDIPMCSSCKSKNYTGSYCRERRNPHRDLPWDTVYVEVFPTEKTESTVKDQEENSQEKTESPGIEANGEVEQNETTKLEPERGLKDENPMDLNAINKEKGEKEEDYSHTENRVKEKVEKDSTEKQNGKRKLSTDEEPSKKVKTEIIDKEGENENGNKRKKKEDYTRFFDDIDKTRTFCLEVSHDHYHAQVRK